MVTASQAAASQIVRLIPLIITAGLLTAIIRDTQRQRRRVMKKKMKRVL